MKQTAHTVDPHFAAGAQGSSLYNDDLAPTGVAQRTWRWYHFAALWVGMVMNIASYMLAAGLTDQGMSPWQAVLTVQRRQTAFAAVTWASAGPCSAMGKKS